jgi:hypothetical protein
VSLLNNTNGRLFNLLKRLEWSYTYSYCTGWPCCPICRGIKPGCGRDAQGDLPNNQGHRSDCTLKETIDELTRKTQTTQL